MKVLIILAIIYFVYRHFKGKMLESMGSANDSCSRAQGSADDVMVQDPECEIYFPLRDGVPGMVNGKSINFCSTECRDAYMKKHR